MTKMKKIIFSLLLALLCVLSFTITINKGERAIALENSALSDTQISSNIVVELEDFIEYGKETKERLDRTAGSQGEYNAAIYLKNELENLNNFQAVNDSLTTDGIQTFEFQNITLDKKMISQNIVYRRETKTGSTKKVILSAHYDSSFVVNEKGENAFVEGINDNAASVATLLAFVKALDSELVDPGFSIEVVFFGAGANAYDGSKYYSEALKEDQIKDVLLMVNLDKIALGNYNYLYVNEFETSQEKYIKQTLEGKVDFKNLEAINLLDFSNHSVNGLSYTHLGLESDHAYFMKRNINVLNFFSGDYEQSLTFGISEYVGEQAITYTINDNYEYIKENHGDFTNNLVNVYKALDLLIYDEDFVSNMQKDNALEEKYEFWTNEKLAVFVTSIILIVFCIIYYLIYLDLNKKSQKRAKDAKIDQIVVKISTNIGDEDQMLNDYIDKKVKDDTKTKKDEE